jgi:hypothetical protein
MKRTLLSCLAFAMVFSAKSQIILEDNFDAYSAGMGVAEQSTSWDTWDGSAGLDGLVSTDYANSGVNSAKIQGTSVDLVLPIGPYTTGAYEISWKMYLPAGQGGYFNALHNWSASSTAYEWACDVFFDISGNCTSTIGGVAGTPTAVTQDTWFDVKILADLNNDNGKVWVNGVMIGDWVWSTNNANGTAGTNQLSAVDFYGTTNVTNGSGLYYVDDVKLEQVTIASVNENTSKVEVPSFYPNPVSSALTINTPESWTGGEIMILDLTGRVIFKDVLSIENTTRQINVNEFSQGIYFVKWTKGQSTMTKRFTKS